MAILNVNLTPAFLAKQYSLAHQNYFKKMRLFNLPDITINFSKYIELSHALELYSESPEEIREGCTASQTKQHRSTKIKAINGFVEALKDGEIREIEAKGAVKEMLAFANVKRNGTSRAGQLARQLTREEVGNRICKV